MRKHSHFWRQSKLGQVPEAASGFVNALGKPDRAVAAKKLRQNLRVFIMRCKSRSDDKDWPLRGRAVNSMKVPMCSAQHHSLHLRCRSTGK